MAWNKPQGVDMSLTKQKPGIKTGVYVRAGKMYICSKKFGQVISWRRESSSVWRKSELKEGVSLVKQRNGETLMGLMKQILKTRNEKIHFQQSHVNEKKTYNDLLSSGP